MSITSILTSRGNDHLIRIIDYYYHYVSRFSPVKRKRGAVERSIHPDDPQISALCIRAGRQTQEKRKAIANRAFDLGPLKQIIFVRCGVGLLFGLDHQQIVAVVAELMDNDVRTDQVADRLQQYRLLLENTIS